MGSRPSHQESSTKSNFTRKLTEGSCNSINIHSVYRFHNTIGQGSFGTVKRGTNIKNPHEQVAIKTIPMHKIISQGRRLKSEIEILLLLDHPNIIKCYEVFEDISNIHIVMEYLPGGELTDIFPNKGNIEEPLALLYTRCMLMAVNHIHQIGIVHRDLKPENFMFSNTAFPEDLKLVDFGLSNKFSNKFEKLHSTVGTPFFIAPEVLKGNYDFKCDLWSVGVILFIMLSGEIPFYGETVSEVFKKVEIGAYTLRHPVWENVSEESKHLVTKLLCINIHDRLSASEALMHPAIFSIPKTLKGDLNIINKIKKYSKKSFLSQCFNTAVARHLKFTKIIEQRDIFNIFDRNLKGTIGAIEICDTLEEAGIQFTQHNLSKIISQVGIREKGKLYFSEFISVLIDIHSVDEPILQLAFDFFDRERKGVIDVVSLVEAVKILGKNLDLEQDPNIIQQVSSCGLISYQNFISHL